jgi:hypothetical protein
MRRITRTTARRTTAAVALAAAVAPAVLGLSAGSASAAGPLAVTKIEGAAGNAAGLQPTVDAYRALLGNPDNASTPGSQAAGRREINWDGVSDELASPNLLPRDFFNTTAPRGAVFSTAKGNKFQVSADADNPAHAAVRFGNINAANEHRFATFSAQRLFSPIGTTVMNVHFFEPGTHKPATVNGFGAVFTDVDRSDSTKVELYDRWGQRLWGKNVLKGTKSSGSLSFLGVKTNADIHTVRITSGNTPLTPTATEGGWKDLVVMDDFLYSEPERLH